MKRIVTLELSETIVSKIDKLVQQGKYSSRSEFIRLAIQKLLKEEGVW